MKNPEACGLGFECDLQRRVRGGGLAQNLHEIRQQRATLDAIHRDRCGPVLSRERERGLSLLSRSGKAWADCGGLVLWHSADRDRLDEEMARLKSNLQREQAWAHADDDDELRCVRVWVVSFLG